MRARTDDAVPADHWKVCRQCGLVRPHGIDRSTRDGLARRCRGCTRDAENRRQRHLARLRRAGIDPYERAALASRTRDWVQRYQSFPRYLPVVPPGAIPALRAIAGLANTI